LNKTKLMASSLPISFSRAIKFAYTPRGAIVV